MIQKAKFLFFCTVFVASAVFGQKKFAFTNFKPVVFKNTSMSTISIKNTAALTPSTTKFANHFNLAVNSNPLIKSTESFIPTNFYTQNFGFFCKKELQLQKAIKVPFVFRLGSVDMCDRLEGKGK